MGTRSMGDEEEQKPVVPVATMPAPLAGQIGPEPAAADRDEWSFLDSYKEHVTRPKYRWNLNVIVPFQNIITSGGGAVRDNILKRQETYGVAYALILGCSLAVLVIPANLMGPDTPCADSLYTLCYTQQVLSGVAVGASLLVELVVMNNIAFVSSASTVHIGYIVYNYQWMFTIPTATGLQLTLIPMIFATGLGMSICGNGKFAYGPALILYTFLFLTLVVYGFQSWFLTRVKKIIVAETAKNHFPELDFVSCGEYGDITERDPENMPL